MASQLGRDVIALLLGMMRIAHLDVNVQTGRQAEQGRREVAPFRTANPTRVTIQGDLAGPPGGEQRLRQALQSRLAVKSGRTCASMSSEVLIATMFNGSTTCCCLPPGEGRFP